MVNLLALIALFSSPHANAAFVSAKCTQPLNELLSSLKSTYRCKTPSKSQIPVECQSFQVKELTQSQVSQVSRWLKRYGKSFSLDQKISVAFGDLISICQNKEPERSAEERTQKETQETLAVSAMIRKLPSLKTQSRFTREDYESDCKIDYKVCALLGMYEYEHGNRDEAAQIWKRLCFEKRHLVSCFELGEYHFNERRLHEAVKAFDQACSIDDSSRNCDISKTIRGSQRYRAIVKE